MAKDDRQSLRQDLIEYCGRVPPSINSGSYDLTLRFKADVVKYRRLAAKPGVSEHELRAAINQMDSYWR